MVEIPAAFHDLFEKPTFAQVVTMTPDGRPHATSVWIDYDATRNRLLVNTERGRRKERNVAEDPTVAVSMVDPENPYRFLSVTGEVEETTTEGAREQIDVLAERYMGESAYPNPIETERVILRIRPDEVLTGGQREAGRLPWVERKPSRCRASASGPPCRPAVRSYGRA